MIGSQTNTLMPGTPNMATSPTSTTRFDPAAFPQYAKLNRTERAFLRTCCYYPPRPRRVRTPELVHETATYIATFERAFGPELWPMIAGKDVLDFGCGEGGFTLALAEQSAGHVVGLDILPDFTFAQEEAKTRGYPVEFVGASSETLPDATFDVVISHDSFEHFAEPEAILREMIRLARPGGRILIKFGPPWRNPWGRHMSGTVRRDRPWVHLLVPERVVMHAHSVYHDDPVLSEKYEQLPGGMNQMTVGRFKRLIKQQEGIMLQTLDVLPMYSIGLLVRVPGVAEYFASGVRAICVRTGS